MNTIRTLFLVSLLILSAGSVYAQTTNPTSPTDPNATTPPSPTAVNGALGEICDQGTCTVSNLFNPSMPWMGTAPNQTMLVGERIIGTALFPAQPRYNAVPGNLNNGVTDWRVIAFIDGKTPDTFFVPVNTLTEFLAFVNNHRTDQMDVVIGCPETTVQLCGQDYPLPLARNLTTRLLHYVNPQYPNVVRDITYQCNAPALPRGAWGAVANSDTGSCTPPQCFINGTTDVIYANQGFRHGQSGGWNWGSALPSLGLYDIGTTITVIQTQTYGICGPDDTNYITYNCIATNGGANWTEAFNCVPPPTPTPTPTPTPGPSASSDMCTNNMAMADWMNQAPAMAWWGITMPTASFWFVDGNTNFYLCDWSSPTYNDPWSGSGSGGGGPGGSGGGDD